MTLLNKRICALLLLAALLLTSVTACGETAPEETAASVQTPSAAEETVSEEIEFKYASEVPVIDLEGRSVGLATDSLSSTYYNLLDVEELTGEILNDAIYDRNRRIEDLYNMKFNTNATGGRALLEACVVSGSRDVDLAYYLQDSVPGQISKGYLMPFDNLEYVDMTKPYWDQTAIETLSVNGKIFHGYVDFGFDHYDSMAILFYNGEIVTDFNLDDPHELYLEQEWTMDKMHDMMQAVAADLNGDGEMTITRDRYGFVGRQFTFLTWIHASGLDLMKVEGTGEDTQFTLNLLDEKLMKVGDLASDMLNNPSLSSLGGTDENRTAFTKGDALFYSRLLGDFRLLREQEDDYGIIGYPAIDGSHEGNRVYVQCPTTLVVAVDTDPEITGLILEAIAADTYDNVLDLYIEKAVIGKGTRDAQSAEMLRIMIRNRAYDLAYAYDIGTALSAWEGALIKGSYSSTQSRYASKIKKEADKKIESILKYSD